MTLEKFIQKIPDFDKLSAGRKIDYFVYYQTIIREKEGASSREVDLCFDDLKISKYSNIAQYLKSGSVSGKGKHPKFIGKKGLYHLERTKKAEIEAIIHMPVIVDPTSNYFPLELFDHTRTYLNTVSLQAAACYDQGLYDACSVMTRKLLEILIIECFERYKISDKIKNPAGNFFYLSDLMDIFKNESTWNMGRNTKASLPNLKKMGDLSAHNRYYTARKIDVDNLKEDLRIVLEALLLIIDYPNWNKSI